MSQLEPRSKIPDSAFVKGKYKYCRSGLVLVLSCYGTFLLQGGQVLWMMSLFDTGLVLVQLQSRLFFSSYNCLNLFPGLLLTCFQTPGLVQVYFWIASPVLRELLWWKVKKKTQVQVKSTHFGYLITVCTFYGEYFLRYFIRVCICTFCT